MIELTLKRIIETANSTAGAMLHGSKFLHFIIEDGHHEPKIKGKTRIPAGRYRCQKSTDTRFNELYKEKFGHKWVMRVLEVPGFEGIEIHIGNKVENTDGCLLPNLVLAYDKAEGNFYGKESGFAYQAFYNYIESLNDDEIWITVK